MIKSYEKTFEIFDDLSDLKKCPPQNYKEGLNCDTSFRYQLDNAGKKVAQVGMTDFRKSVALMLAFNSQIESITVNDLVKGAKEVYKVNSRSKVGSLIGRIITSISSSNT